MASWLAASVVAISLVAAPQPESPRPKLKQRTAQGMVIGGAVGTAVMTWTAGLVAARLLDTPDPTRQAMGRRLVLPVAGPALAAAEGPDDARAIASLSVYQAASIAVLTVGATSLVRRRRYEQARGEWKPASSNTGALLASQGIVWFGMTWGMTFGFARDKAKRGDPFSRRMQVPLVGGLLAAPHAPNHTRGYLGLTATALQLSAAALLTTGAVMIARHRKRRRAEVTLLPVPTRGGGQLNAAIRF